MWIAIAVVTVVVLIGGVGWLMAWGSATALAKAVQTGDPDAARAALSRGEDPSQLVNVSFGYEKLRIPAYAAAVLTGKPEMLVLFLDRGADINVPIEAPPPYRGNTPLHFAVMAAGVGAAPPEYVRFFLDRGADPNARNHVQETPLCTAAEYPAVPQTARELLEHGADPNASVEGLTALHMVAEALATPVQFGELCQDQGDLDVPATVAKATEFAGYLLEHGADVNARTDSGKTPLSVVRAYCGETDVAEFIALLVNHGATE